VKPITAEWIAKPEDDSLAQITAVLAEVLRSQPCAVYLFGSRAAGTNSPVSDYDIAVLAQEDISYELSLAREQLEESNIPYTVDLVDLQATSALFASKVLQEGLVLWKN
jgi:hypothetical protein